MTITNLVLLEAKMKNQSLSPTDKTPSDSLMKSLETENDNSHKHLSAPEAINLTEWLIFKIKVIYGRAVFEGDNPTEASAIRQEWQDLVVSIGKKGVLATVDYLLSGHHAVPTFPPSPVEFRKCYRMHVSASVVKEIIQSYLAPLTKAQRERGYQSIKEILVCLKTGGFVGNSINKNSFQTPQRMRIYSP